MNAGIFVPPPQQQHFLHYIELTLNLIELYSKNVAKMGFNGTIIELTNITCCNADTCTKCTDSGSLQLSARAEP